MTNFIQSVDDRTNLAGTNRMEVLLFSLGEDANTGRNEVFGINVFKVREVMHMPEITQAPDMPDSVEGVVSLRGAMVPVINLPRFCGVQAKEQPNILMVTEYNMNIQGFMVHSVDTIKRLAWDEVKVPPQMLTNRMGGVVTAVAELENNTLVMIMDVEKVLAETAGFYNDESIFSGIESVEDENLTVLFCDDSSVAREQISATFERMGIQAIVTKNGVEAWERLKEYGKWAETSGRSVRERIQIILTDVEMPEMDGYVLTRKVKADPRLREIPVIMHSSLTSDSNQLLGERVGADAYVPKFEPIPLANTIKEWAGKLGKSAHDPALSHPPAA